MSNKELYDAAVANGLEFTYFRGEDECPDEWEDEIQEKFWNMEAESAERNCEKVWALEFYKRDTEHDKNTSDESQKRIPPFISEATNISDARKAVAYDCYSELRYSSNGFGSLDENQDTMNESFKQNDNRGFDAFFNC